MSMDARMTALLELLTVLAVGVVIGVVDGEGLVSMDAIVTVVCATLMVSWPSWRWCGGGTDGRRDGVSAEDLG